MDEIDLSGNRILLVEDEESFAEGLEYNLNAEGYRVVRAADGERAVELFPKQEFDLVVLDVMLPYLDGFEVARRIRRISPQVPILMLTARSAETDRINGLEAGADDYLTKPFHLKEFLLRIQGMLRRKTWYRIELGSKSKYRFGRNDINFADLTVNNGEDSFRLTPLEAALVRYLIDNPGRVISREELLEKVWQSTAGIETRTVENFIVRIRKRFEIDPGNPVYFKTVRGAGYLFQPDQ